MLSSDSAEQAVHNHNAVNFAEQAIYNHNANAVTYLHVLYKLKVVSTANTVILL